MYMPEIFCPICQRYIGLKSVCVCGWKRPDPAESTAPDGSAWKTDVGQPIMGSPVLFGNNLILTYGARAGASGGMVVLDAATGMEIWRHDVGSCVEGGVALYEHTAIFGDENGKLHAVDLHTQQDASPPVSLDGAIAVAPLIDEVRVYAVTSQGVIACLDARYGFVVSQARVRASHGYVRIASAPAISARGLLVSALDGGLYTFDFISGNLERVFQANAGIYTTPVVFEGRAIITTKQGELCAVNLRTGQPTWTVDAGKPFRVAPLLDGDTLYAAPQDHKLHAIHAKSGERLWTFDAGYNIVSPPHFTNGLLVCGCSNGRIIAVEPPASPAAPARQVWEFDTESDRPSDDDVPAAVYGGFTADANNILFGAYNRRAYALPWHMGQYAFLATRAEQFGKWLDAATYTILAAGPGAEERAAQMLSKGGQHAEAARIYESLGITLAAAEEYETAARSAASPAALWNRAADLYLDAGNLREARRSRLQAAQASNTPLLQIDLVSCEALKVGLESTLRLQVMNLTASTARRVTVSVASTSFAAGEVSCAELVYVGPAWSCELKLTPLQSGVIPMKLALQYTDAGGNPMPVLFWSHDVTVAAPDQQAVAVDRWAPGPARVAGDPRPGAGVQQQAGAPEAAEAAQRVRLYEVLNGELFTLEDLEDLCFRLVIDWDALDGTTKPSKVRALLRYCVARGRLIDLQNVIGKVRPNLRV